MRRVLVLVLALGLVPAGAVAQQTSTQATGAQSTAATVNNAGAQAQSQTAAAAKTQGAANGQIAAGSTLQAALSKSIEAKKAKTGDEIVAKTTTDAKSDGKVIIPKGTKLIGHVTEAKARASGDSESMLAIAFDKAVLKSGQEIPISATILAIGAAQQSADLSAGQPISAPQTSGPGYGRAGGSGGVVNNTAATVGSAAGGVVNTAGNVGAGGLGGAPGAQTGAVLNSSARGVVGISGIELQSGTSAQAGGSVMTSKDKNVKLDSGTQMILQVQSK